MFAEYTTTTTTTITYDLFFWAVNVQCLRIQVKEAKVSIFFSKAGMSGFRKHNFVNVLLNFPALEHSTTIMIP